MTMQVVIAFLMALSGPFLFLGGVGLTNWRHAGNWEMFYAFLAMLFGMLFFVGGVIWLVVLFFMAVL
jgi:hypothetical protein